MSVLILPSEPDNELLKVLFDYDLQYIVVEEMLTFEDDRDACIGNLINRAASLPVLKPHKTYLSLGKKKRWQK